MKHKQKDNLESILQFWPFVLIIINFRSMRAANQPLTTQGRPLTIELTIYLVTIRSEKNQPSFCLFVLQQTVVCMYLSTHIRVHTHQSLA